MRSVFSLILSLMVCWLCEMRCTSERMMRISPSMSWQRLRMLSAPIVTMSEGSCSSTACERATFQWTLTAFSSTDIGSGADIVQDLFALS